LDYLYPDGACISSHRGQPRLPQQWDHSRLVGGAPAHPRIQHTSIPVGAAWPNLIEGWWRILRRNAFTGVSVASAADIAYATRIATARLNRHAKPWVWGDRRPHTASCVGVSSTAYEERRII
jgi:hypothetical protein